MRIEDLFSNVVAVIWLWFSRYCIKPQQFITVINYMQSLWTHYTPRERSSMGFIWITLSLCLSVRLSVHIRVWTITFLWFDIRLSYLAHGCITIRRCVAYIHDPDTTLNFDLKVKFIGFLTFFCVRSMTIFYLT